MGDAKRRIIYEWFVRQKRRLEGVYPGAAHLNNTINPKVRETNLKKYNFQKKKLDNRFNLGSTGSASQLSAVEIDESSPRCCFEYCERPSSFD